MNEEKLTNEINILNNVLKIKLKFFNTLLAEYFKNDKIKKIDNEITANFNNLLKNLPDIGDIKENHFAKFLPLAAQNLAIYSILKQEKLDIKEIGKIFFEELLLETRSIPEWYNKITEKDNWQSWTKLLKKWAPISMKRKYPMDNMYKYIPKSKDFTFGLDMYESTIIKYFKANNAEDIIPYFGMHDYVVCDLIGFGLVRTKTLHEGDDLTDYRFKIGKTSKMTDKETARLAEMNCEYY